MNREQAEEIIREAIAYVAVDGPDRTWSERKGNHERLSRALASRPPAPPVEEAPEPARRALMSFTVAALVWMEAERAQDRSFGEFREEEEAASKAARAFDSLDAAYDAYLATTRAENAKETP